MADQNQRHNQMLLPLTDDDADTRAALVARWMTIVRDVLPTMAKRCDWPISQDHCFMRVCLDTALGAPWHTLVKRPAIRHLSDAQLSAAIAVAEAIVHAPETLDDLNLQSIRWRKAQR